MTLTYDVVFVKMGYTEPEQMEAESPYYLISQLLDLWVSGDVEMTGIIAFLEANGVASPIEDEEIVEFDEDDPDNEPIINRLNLTVELVCMLCCNNVAKLQEFIDAIAPSIVIKKHIDDVSESEDDD